MTSLQPPNTPETCYFCGTIEHVGYCKQCEKWLCERCEKRYLLRLGAAMNEILKNAMSAFRGKEEEK